MTYFRNFFSNRASSVFLVFIVLFAFFSFFSPEHRFIRPENLGILMAEGSEFCIVVLGVGLLMICGEFDLSIGSILVFCSFIFIRLFQAGMNLFIVWLIVLVLGAAIGFLNGIITVKGGFAVAFDRELSPGFTSLLTGTVAKTVPVQAIWFVAIALLLGFLLHSHKFGNWVYATGGNLSAARAMGIRTDRVKIICFLIVGTLCGFVGMMQVVRVSSFFSRAGDGWELKAIAASVVGGTALMGGRGSMTGIFLGALIISIIENALVMLRITYFWTYMVFGFVIITSVILRTSIERSRLSR